MRAENGGHRGIDDAKYFGRVYTPPHIVNLMLDALFAGSLGELRICDPACGTGDFLVPLAEELCRRAAGAPENERRAYRATLKQLTGYDVDGAAVRRCRERLSDVTQRLLGRRCPENFWRIRHEDALDAWRQDAEAFDWVIGNPPYVRIQHLERPRREKIKQSGWQYFQGSSDLYIVFFELGLRLLKDGGNLIYISPSGWLRNDAGGRMRRDLEKNHGIAALYDFRDRQAFPGVSTYTCITQVRKGACEERGKIYRWNGKGFTNSCKLAKSGSRWAVVAPSAARSTAGASLRLRDIADIHVGIQTLADKVFILEVKEQGKDLVACNAGGREVVVERGATRRILKASVMKNGRDRVERVAVFPYDSNGRLMPEADFMKKFPRAYAWLLENRERLLARDKGAADRAKWYGYGREVGVKNAWGRKILTSAMNAAPGFQICDDPQSLFYSGYCVKPRTDVSLRTLVKMLNSPEMDRHVRAFSQPFRNGWFSYAKRYIQDFPLPRDKVNAIK